MNCARISTSGFRKRQYLPQGRLSKIKRRRSCQFPGTSFIFAKSYEIPPMYRRAYLSNNPTQASEIPNLISQVHAALMRVSSGRPETPLEPAKPAVSVKKSLTPEYLVCLEDGKRFKSLKRHLRTQYNMTPEQYRDKWSLPPDYPMVAPNYAVARSQLAKKMGLGQQARKRK
jgi:predicted transcriptional regulator